MKIDPFYPALVALIITSGMTGYTIAHLGQELNSNEVARLEGTLDGLEHQRMVYERALDEKQALVVEYGARRAEIANELREYRRRVESLTNTNSSLSARLQALQQRSIHDGQD